MTGKDKQLKFLLIFLLILGCMVFYLYLTTKGIDFSNYQIIKPNNTVTNTIKYPGLLKIESSTFANNTDIPIKYTCKGSDINPPLTFSNVPKDTKSLVLIVDDQDAPYKVWTHWIVFNINPNVTYIRENSVPYNSMLGESDAGKDTYEGPCPPLGKHRYRFKLYALSQMLNLEKGATVEEVENSMNKLIIDKAELIGTFQR